MFGGETFPCVVQLDGTRGRFLTAKRDIKQGELVFQEKPLIVGPCGIGIEKSKAFSTCLGCYKNVTSLYKCSKCGWPVCNPQCELMPDHANFECIVFADCPVSPITNPPEYEKIKILRCLMLKEKFPDVWKLLMNLESHPDIRKQSFYAVSNNISYYKFIRQECHLKQFGFDEIHHIAGVSAINSYHATSGLLGHNNSDGNSRYASFLFYYASLVSHDCTPNTRTVIQQKGKNYVINVIALRNIPAGQSISASYVEPNLGTLERREHLLENFYFACKCKRCQDPTECGSNYSAVKCNSCKSTGYLLPRNSLDPHSEYQCGDKTCGQLVRSTWITNLLSEVKSRMRNCHTLDEFEKVVGIYKGSILHRNHYLVISMECDMIRLIDEILHKVDPLEMIRLSKWQIELCRHCLSVADLIHPGANRFRGNLLCFLQEALLTSCTCRIDSCTETKDLGMIRKRCKKQFVEALEIISESKMILMSEPINSLDWQRGKMLSIDTERIKSLMTCLSFKD